MPRLRCLLPPPRTATAYRVHRTLLPAPLQAVACTAPWFLHWDAGVCAPSVQSMLGAALPAEAALPVPPAAPNAFR
jgi:hypothetical protein